MITDSCHSPFVQLPLEDRALFFIYASAALARFRSRSPAPDELAVELERAWNANRLSPADLSDPCRMTRLLEVHFTPPLNTRATDARSRHRRER